MANKRISALDNLGATPAVGDILPITDIDDPTGSPQGTTKGVTFSDLTNHLATAVSLGNHASLTSAVHGISAFGATLVDDANAATARTTLGVDAAGTDNSTDVTLAGTPDYITIVGQTITRNQIDLAADVTGSLPNTSVSGLGTASTQDVGTADGNVVQLSDVGGTVKLPAVDGSQLTNVSGTDSTKLAIASNLSDLNDAATARTNLGLGTAATTASTDYATSAQGGLADTAVQPSDNISTLTNDSGFITGLTAGALSDFDFDDNAIFGFGASVNTPTITANAYTVTDADNGKVLALDNGATAMDVNINTGLPAGFNCSFIQTGSGQVTFAGTATLNNRQSHTKINAQYGVASIVAYTTDTYILAGDTAS